MIYNQSNYLWKAIGLGAIAGMRTMSAPSFLSTALTKLPSPLLAKTPFRYLQSDYVSKALQLMATSELIGDKLPNVPDRIKLPSLIARTASGGLVGATLFTVNKDKALKGALIGAIAAAAATFGSYYLRQALNRNTPLPSSVSGNLEDALILGSGLMLVKE
jgi:uncharacterized membrane protein